jgi:hypothetical protein
MKLTQIKKTYYYFAKQNNGGYGLYAKNQDFYNYQQSFISLRLLKLSVATRLS